MTYLEGLEERFFLLSFSEKLTLCSCFRVAMKPDRTVVWHRHFFSPHCPDEVRGRFDAVEHDDGTFHVGSRQLTPCATRDEAVQRAEAAAAAWREADDEAE